MVRGIYFSIIVLIGFSTNILSQTTESEYVIRYDFFEGDDPNRFFIPADFGIHAGDLNGDGTPEYVQYVYSADWSTEELGDKIGRNRVCNYSDDPYEEMCTIYEGAQLYPVGDLNGDGRDDLAVKTETGFRIYRFAPGEIDISSLSNDFVDVDAPNDFDSSISGHDVNGDGTHDYVYIFNEPFSDSRICTIFGDENDELAQTCTEIDPILGNVAIRAVYGDLVGDGENELVVLASDDDTFPYDVSISTCPYNDQDALECSDETFVGTSDYPADQMRMFIGNFDGVNKDDVVFSHDRYTGFDRTVIFYQDPTTYIIQSNPEASKKPFTQARVLRNNATVENASTNDGISTAISIQTSIVTLVICASENIDDPSEHSDETYNGEEVCEDPDEVLFGESTQQTFREYIISQYENRYGNFGADTENRVGFVDRFNVQTRSSQITNNTVNNSFGIVSTGQHNDVTPRTYDHSDVEISSSGSSIAGLLVQAFGLYDGNRFLNSDEFFERVESDRIEQGNRMGVVNDKITGYGPKKSKNTNEPSDESEISFYDDLPEKTLKAINTLIKVDSIETKDFQTFDEGKIYIALNAINDINNDGLEELLVGTTRSTLNDGFINKAWLFMGQEDYSEMPQVTFDFATDLSLQSFSYAGIGEVFEGLGDVNGDGINDFAIGLPGYDQSGAVFVYFGIDQSIDNFTESTFTEPDVILSPRLLNGQFIFYFGSQVTGGDFNGDGFNDIAVLNDNTFNGPPAPAVQIFLGGTEMDGEADEFLFVPTVYNEGEATEFAAQHYYATIEFLPSENDSSFQDIIYVPGPRSGINDATIYHGGSSRDSLPDITLVNPNRTIEFGFDDRTKPIVADFNEDGFYDILLTNQFENEEAFVSNGLYLFSPNTEITISNEELENPLGFALAQNYPNPFNPSTKIEFRLGSASSVNLTVFDILGREVATLISDQTYQQGSHTVQFDATNLSSGIYLYRLEANGFVQTRKMMLIK